MPEIRRFVSAFRDHFLNAWLFSFFINLVLLVPPLYMLQIFDRVLTSRSAETLVMLTLVAVLLLLVLLALDYLRGRLLLAAGAVLDRRLGERVIFGLIEGAARVDRLEQAHGLRDVAVLRGFLGGNSIIALFDAPWLVFFILLIFLFHPLLGFVAVLGALSLFLLALANEKLNRGSMEQTQLDARRAARFIDQGLRNADVLNGMGMAEGFVARWRALNDPVLAGSAASGRRVGLISSVSRFARQLLQISMLATGAYLVVEAHLTPGVMLATTVLLGRALAPVESLIANWNNLVQARAAFARLRPFLAGDGAASPRTRLPPPTGQVAVERLGLAGLRPDRPILRNLNFELAAGESLAVVGPSASGKSSLTRLLVGVWMPTTGCVRLDGAEVSGIPRADLGPHVGYLPQDVELFAGTISENIARLGPPDSGAVVAAAQRARVHELILRLPEGYDTRIGEGGAVLSGGQMQRIGLARALYGDPRLVVLDEPNANLDAEGEASLAQVVAALKLDGVTTVMVTHKPSLLGSMDKVLVLREGQMELFGPRPEVLARILPPAAVSAGAAA